MGSTVLNGSSWPLNRDRMARLLGFAAVADNAYDAGQISGAELPVEIGAVATSVALHCGAFVQSVMTQYADPRPWILLRPGQGTTYVSSAMPQKLNPGLLNNLRVAASRLVTLGVGRAIAAHNVPPGMIDPRGGAAEIVDAAVDLLNTWSAVMAALVVDPARALDALNSDWTASQELADELMRAHKVPFRLGHHFAADLVAHARASAWRPTEFPYSAAREIYARVVADAVEEAGGRLAVPSELPLTEDAFRRALDPVAIVRARRTRGGPQPSEVERMIGEAREALRSDGEWVDARRRAVEDALGELDALFARYLAVEADE
ncbi:L-Aspartase-like protein [Zopfochytrium polystomum]|nr:L-Aspartase-like protein [Zopfochytrium polystomum]